MSPIALSDAAPISTDRDWLVASLAAHRAAHRAAYTHAARRVDEPHAAVFGCFAADGAAGGSFNACVAGQLARE